MNRNLLKTCIVTILICCAAATAKAQCPESNQAFSSGECLVYNLYYNWKFIWIKAGNASLSTVGSKFRGQEAFRTSLITRVNKRVEDFFVLRDTLLCYASENMVPLYFRKGAREGDRYTVDEVWYSYRNGNTMLRQHRLKHDGTSKWKNAEYQNCIHDMMSIFLSARSLKSDSWKPGHVENIPLADGDDVTPAILKYRGKANIKGDNGIKYHCLELSYLEKDDGKLKEIVRFYITDDDNHIPVRLDLFLRIGCAKAFLVDSRGVRNPVTSQIK